VFVAEPQDEAADGAGGSVVGRESAEAFELAEAALDDVAAPVDRAVAAAAPGADGELG